MMPNDVRTPSSRAAPPWKLREASASDREAIIGLRRQVFQVEDPEKQQPEFWDWEFNQGPEGPARLFVAEDGDAIVGHYAIIPQDFVLGGEPAKGSIVVDVMTHPDYRFQGMFKKIGRFSLAAASDGIAFATGYPIRKEVMPGHLSIGWVDHLKLPVMVRPLAWRGIARRFGVPFGAALDWLALPWRSARRLLRPQVAGEERIVVLAGSDAGELAAVAAEGLVGISSHRIRSAGFFEWRYFGSPIWKYRIVGLRKGAELVAYVITRRVSLLGTDSLAIVDLGCRPGAVRGLDVLLDSEIERGRSSGLAVAGAMISTGNVYHRALRRAGFYPGPHRFSLIVYALQAACRQRLTDKANGWFLTWGDTDDV
jgi:hypothetical protein